MVILGILFGLAAAGGVAFLVCSLILLKSNDFGNTNADIDQYTGYNPVNIVNEGRGARLLPLFMRHGHTDGLVPSVEERGPLFLRDG